jgi:predicted ArsR family transcriptional regulator
VAEILAEGVEGSTEATTGALDAAGRRGHEIAGTTDAPRTMDGLVATLIERGYEPVKGVDGTIRLRNCPFDRLATEHRDLTCSLNLAMLGAVAEHFGDAVAARVDPVDGWCCVALTPAH